MSLKCQTQNFILYHINTGRPQSFVTKEMIWRKRGILQRLSKMDLYSFGSHSTLPSHPHELMNIPERNTFYVFLSVTLKPNI